MFEDRDDYVKFINDNCRECKMGDEWCLMFYDIIRGMHYLPEVFPEKKIKNGECLEKNKVPRRRPRGKRAFAKKYGFHRKREEG